MDRDSLLKIERWYADPSKLSIELKPDEFTYLPYACYAVYRSPEGHLSCITTDDGVREILDEVDSLTIKKSPKYRRPKLIVY